VKVAIITDTHFGFKKGNKIFHDYFQKFYENVFHPYLIKNNINTVIHLGDSFDNRKGIDYWSLKWAQDIFYNTLETLGITVYNIVGNHDIYYKNTNSLNSLEYLLQDYDNVIKISSPTEVNIDGLDILFLPWINQENEKTTFNLIQNTTCQCAMGHLELQGFRVNKQIVMEHGLEGKLFEKFQRVFSGHYHTRSNDGRIFYVGNPYHLFWSDLGDPRGFTVFDTDTMEHEHINNPYDIFKVIEYDEDNLNEDLNEYENCIVKVVVKNKNDQKKYEKYLDKLVKCNPYELKLIESCIINTNIELPESNAESEDTLSLLKRYVDESEVSLNKNEIKRLINSIYQESYQI
jgi:DNA repair exonuclease SbcCD nuclease subunit